jgi:hypothetical protein
MTQSDLVDNLIEISDLEAKWLNVIDEVDDSVSKLIKSKLKELNSSRDHWEFCSGNGTYFFTRNGEIIDTYTQEGNDLIIGIIDHLDAINEIFVYSGYYPSFNSEDVG